jgi:hypothetical protein
MKPLLLLAVLGALMSTSCSNIHESAGAAVSYPVPKVPAELVKEYYRQVKWRLPEPQEAYAYLLDEPNFLRRHREEMLRTLEIAETVETEKVGVCFVRYSIGSDIYREVTWLRKLEGAWFVCERQYVSSYGDDPLKDGKPDRAKELIKRTEEWEKNSKERW